MAAGCRRGEQVDQGAIGVAKQQRAVAPRHGRGRLCHGYRGRHSQDAFVVGVDVVDQELDDDRSVGRSLRDITAEQRQRSVVPCWPVLAPGTATEHCSSAAITARCSINSRDGERCASKQQTFIRWSPPRNARLCR